MWDSLRNICSAKRRKQQLLDDIKREREASLNAIDQKRLEALREINEERKLANKELQLVAEERNKYLTEMVAIVQAEVSMVREITGKDWMEGLERMKSVLNIESATIDNLIAKPNASDGNRPSNSNSKEET